MPRQRNRDSRRAFLTYASAVATTAVAMGCDVKSLGLAKAFAQATAVDVGSGDFGVLNFAYASEQLGGAFYTQVLTTPYRGMSDYELQVFTGIRDHEVAHRETFRLALNIFAIPDLTPNFSAIDFRNRAQVLRTTQMIEDLEVSAYNGAGALITNPLFLAIAGSIVSVEARHAALVRDIIRPHSAYFAGDDVVDSHGLDRARLPSQVLPRVSPLLATPVTASQLP